MGAHSPATERISFRVRSELYPETIPDGKRVWVDTEWCPHCEDRQVAVEAARMAAIRYVTDMKLEQRPQG